jgi:hypothetical protein
MQSQGLANQTIILEKIALFSCEEGNPIIIELIIEEVNFEYNFTLNFDKQTALFIAIINQKTTVLSYLIGKEANKNL